MYKKSDRSLTPEVAAVFDSYPQNIKLKLLYLRNPILDTAASIEGIGKIEETLRWGEPGYLTSQSKMGSTIRIAWKEDQKEQYSIFFKCTANLVPAFREKFPENFKFAGNRSINFDLNDEIPVKELKQCIAMALTYHRNKKLKTAARWKMVETIK